MKFETNYQKNVGKDPCTHVCTRVVNVCTHFFQECVRACLSSPCSRVFVARSLPNLFGSYLLTYEH